MLVCYGLLTLLDSANFKTCYMMYESAVTKALTRLATLPQKVNSLLQQLRCMCLLACFASYIFIWRQAVVKLSNAALRFCI